MDDKIKEFREYRARMNEKILAADNKVVKRIYNIDTNTYMDGALSSKVKEMLGLATSMVLRCDDGPPDQIGNGEHFEKDALREKE